ncbi:MAG: hypothetical protein ACO29V_15030 [Limnohabitans sp.]|jgi:hypothetical protein
MKTHFHDPAIAPVTPEQLRSVGVDPTDLYWSGTFRSWRFAGATASRSPYFSTGQILHELGLTPDPRA